MMGDIATEISNPIARMVPMRRSLIPLLAALVLGCADDPAELPVLTAYTWIEAIPEGSPARAGAAFSGGPVIVVGSDGSVLDVASGVSLVDRHSGTPELLAVWGSDPDHVWAAGRSGGIVSNVSGRWLAEPTPSLVDITDLSGTSADRVFGVGRAGRLMERRDGAWTLHEISGALYGVGGQYRRNM